MDHVGIVVDDLAAATEFFVEPAADQLGEITSRLGGTTGAEAEAITRELFDTAFAATGPDYWR